MKIIAILTALVLSFSATASTNSRTALELSFNEYQYALTTEWDQKDQATFKRINEKLEREVVELLENGLTEADIFSVLSKRSLSKSEIEGLKLRASMAARNGSSSNALSILKDELDRTSVRGASWNGSASMPLIAVGILFAGLIAFAIASTQGECLEEAEFLDCDDSGRDCYYVTRCKTFSL